MISIILKRGERVSEVTLPQFSYAHSLAETVWIDAKDPTIDEIKEISEKTKIPVEKLIEHKEQELRPHVFDADDYSFIVFGIPTEEKKRISSISIFLFGKHGMLTIRKSDFASLGRLKRLIETSSKKESIFATSGNLVFLLLDFIISDYFYIFENFEEKISEIEERIVKNEKLDKMLVEEIFKIKKTLLYFHKAMIANRDVVTSIEKGYITRVTKKDAARFREVYNDIIQLIDTEETFRDILTSVMEIYLTTLSNTMNEIMKKLTVYASIILVPTLIAGIYGMNFKYMPELEWRLGYPFALIIMAVSVILLLIFSKRRKWI
ncbi:MAG: magnesium/cobalt transporter CorA [Candidatus Woesearchaeota archaeon]|nr:magnesium/cobalt transporter CorA [Candidatus Woesearchaeota archaeon]